MKSAYLERPWITHYPEGMDPDLDVPLKSIGVLFDEATERWRNRTAIIFYGKKISYKELQEKVARCAHGLSQLGIKKGDRVALLLLNSPEFVISFYATLKLGAVVTPISPVYVSSEIKHQILDSGAKDIICQDILYEGVKRTGLQFRNIVLTNISESLPAIKKIMGKSILRGVYQKMAAPTPQIFQEDKIHRLKDLIDDPSAEPPEVGIHPKEDLVVLPYTGGTTGPPKGVMITHYNVYANFLQTAACLSNLETGKETLVAFMPYYHAAGQSIGLLYGILQGYTQVTITTPDMDDILTNIVKNSVTFFMGAPTMYEILKDYEKTDKVNWKKLKMILSGADSLHDFTAKDWEARTGVRITEGYGMTETTATSHMNPVGRERYGSIGIPVPSTIAAVLDPDEDRFLPVGEMGEIVISGPQVAGGYWGKPEATEECDVHIDGRRWWRTGDLGRMEEDGYFYIYDRKRDLIKYKGLRVFAREVEEILKAHPDIKEVGVVGVADPKVGENVKAVIVLESDARGKISEGDIREYCKDKLAHYKIPKLVDFVGEIPKTDIGKVSRREIREEEE
ncbi:MAG: AMP-binding protein [Desulfatiglans sp.]|nr:AMP-binding protein [Thermodesulfobacteriota bacterium]MEE4351570.1 AMP-binding protein [Desulfatiglans sp.]